MGINTLKSSSVSIENPFVFNGVINKLSLLSINDKETKDNNEINSNVNEFINNVHNVNNVHKIPSVKKTKQYDAMPKQCLVSAVIAFDNKMFPELSRLGKQVLSQLALLLDIDDPRKPIRILKQTLADATNFKVASIYRALAELEAQELIVRVEQNRKRSGRMGAGILKLTLKAIKILLPNWSGSKYREGVKPNTRLSKKVDGKALPKSQSFSKNQSDVVDKPKYVTLDNGRRMHPELLFLLNKITSPQIFKLMKLAKAQGKLLTDIVAVKAESISSLAGTDLYKFLTYIIKQKEDFSIRAKEIKQIEITLQTEAAKKKEFAEWSQKLYRKNLIHSSLDVRYRITGSPELCFVEVTENGEFKGSRPMCWAFINSIKEGRTALMQ